MQLWDRWAGRPHGPTGGTLQGWKWHEQVTWVWLWVDAHLQHHMINSVQRMHTFTCHLDSSDGQFHRESNYCTLHFHVSRLVALLVPPNPIGFVSDAHFLLKISSSTSQTFIHLSSHLIPLFFLWAPITIQSILFYTFQSFYSLYVPPHRLITLLCCIPSDHPSLPFLVTFPNTLNWFGPEVQQLFDFSQGKKKS